MAAAFLSKVRTSQSQDSDSKPNVLPEYTRKVTGSNRPEQVGGEPLTEGTFVPGYVPNDDKIVSFGAQSNQQEVKPASVGAGIN